MPKFVFFELQTSNFGSSHVFLSQKKWQGQILPNLIFRVHKWHILGTIQGKIHVPLCQNVGFFELETSNFGSSHVFLSQKKWQGQILPNLIFRVHKWHILGTIPGKIHEKSGYFLGKLSITGQVSGCARLSKCMQPLGLPSVCGPLLFWLLINCEI